MKHYTCDKCGMPMDRQNIVRINNDEYDICDICQKKILEKLNNKGRRIEPPDIKELKNKYPRQWDY